MDEAAGTWAAPLPRHGRDRLRAIAPAVLLLVIALLGVRNHVVRDQPSWQGASFGMFATYDNRVSRTVLVTAERDGQPVRIRLPDDLADDARRLAVIPSADAARALAAAVRERLDAPALVRVEVRRVGLDHDGGLELDLRTLVEETAGP